MYLSWQCSQIQQMRKSKWQLLLTSPQSRKGRTLHCQMCWFHSAMWGFCQKDTCCFMLGSSMEEIISSKLCLAQRAVCYLIAECHIVEKHNGPYSYWSEREASSRYQLLTLPLMTPEKMTNSSTRMFTDVKTLLTTADSLTPNARIPKIYRNS